ncbi:MAG: hypothetical protein E7513_03810 [Ruminococcaceae bacterium]|nr:hypothetical protein [Oscillospiraceae bacterium]
MKKILCTLLAFVILTTVLAVPTNAMVVTSDTIDDVVQWAIDTANNNTHGYSQLLDRRWGTPDYDCASFVICAFRSVGFKLSSAAHCGNMKQAFIDEGFEWIPNTKIDLSTSKSLKPGDVLLNTTSHTEIYIGNNTQVGAHDGTYDIYDYNDPGDSTGQEICPVTYSNNSRWEGILRYPVEKPVDVGTNFYAYIVNNVTKKYLTNDNRNVSVRSLTGDANQVWKFERQSDGAYIIRTCFDSKVLNVSYSGTTAGTNVGVYGNSDSPAKRWFVYGSSGKYRFKPKCADLYLDVHGGTSSSKNGTNVCLWTDGASTQKFTIQKLSPPGSTYLDCEPGTSATSSYLWWNATTDTTSYDVKIYKDIVTSGDPYIHLTGLKDTYCRVDLPKGDYEAFVISRNSYSSTQSKNTIMFTVKKARETIPGDVDYNLKLSVFDATTIQMFLADYISLSSTQQAVGDVDKDGKLTILDANRIQLYLANLIDEL